LRLSRGPTGRLRGRSLHRPPLARRRRGQEDPAGPQTEACLRRQGLTLPAEIAVLVLNYNEKECLLRCLEACAKLDQDGVRVNLVCIDNGSGDGSVEAVGRLFPDVRVIGFPRNLGFAPAYNKAISAVDSEWVALLNNDALPDPAWLTAAYAAACRHDSPCVGSRMVK